MTDPARGIPPGARRRRTRRAAGRAHARAGGRHRPHDRADVEGYRLRLDPIARRGRSRTLAFRGMKLRSEGSGVVRRST